MRVLVTGATGLIGSAAIGRLKEAGHDVVAVTRGKGPARDRLPADRFVTVDIARATRVEDWLPHLVGVHAVLNCAGLLQDSPGNSTQSVHVDGVAALFGACEQAGIRRVVHLSAIGVDREQPSDFSRTKFEGDQALMRRDLDWVILRPAVVVGRPAYGASALFRGLAALPVLPVMPQSGDLQIVQLRDLTSTILFFLDPAAPARVAMDVAGPDRLSFTDVVASYRRWLGWPPPRLKAVPGWLAKLAYGLGDAIAWLGWRPPVRSTAAREIARGAVGDNETWRRSTGIQPRSLSAALVAEPASVQERWFARLYFARVIGIGVFAAFWIGTGLISVGPGRELGRGLMLEAGVDEPLASFSVLAGAVADIGVGLAIAFRRTVRAGLYAALAISLFYAAAGTVLLPRLWEDPLGPMLKIWPILALNLLLIAVHEDR